MKSFLVALTFVSTIFIHGQAQTSASQSSTTPAWTEADRKFLLDNLIRSKQELIDETKNLTKKQWNFKESPDRWSINQIVEHIALHELIFMHEISVALQSGPISEFPHHLPDSLFLDQDPQGLKKNVTTDFTKPFSISVPLGNNEGTNNAQYHSRSMH
ncbi:MAG: DinB family protein [Bacteroidota bacterium]